jgi:hypothetical protein
MDIAEKALRDEGYEVVPFNITPEEYAEARDLIVAQICMGTACDLSNDFEQTGEKLQHVVQGNMTLLSAGPILRGVIKTILNAIGMGRTLEATKNVKKHSSWEND